jgi:bacterioferritin-associated ferredoxin
MIVCSCNVLSDHEVRAAMVADLPPRTAGQLHRCLGCEVQCGRCARSIKRIMKEPGGRVGRHEHHAVSRRSAAAGYHRHKI